uniref:ABC-type xenobiotic transporter n=1 Tax=Clastoptera arizonana TaxID=38151 RepID=A0A1B6CUX9_9HEMI
MVCEKNEETILLISNKEVDYGATNGKKSSSKENQTRQSKGLTGLFRYATKWDLVLLSIGILFSTIHGASFPILALVFGQMTNTFLKQVSKGFVEKETYDYADSGLNLTDDFVISQMRLSSTVTTSNFSSLLDRNYPETLSPKEFTLYMETFSVYYLFIGLGVLIAAFIQILCWELACERQVHHLRRIFFQQMLRQDISWYDVNDKGDLSTKLSDDVERVREGIGSKFSMVTQYVATFVSGITVGLLVNWRLTSVLLILAPVLIGSSAYIARMASSTAEREQLKYAIAGGIASEVLNCIRTVVSFGGEMKEITRYGKALDEGRKLAMKKYYNMIFGLLFTTFLMYAQYSVAYYYGAQLIEEGFCTPGSVFTVFFSVLAGAYTLGNALPYLNSIGTAMGAATSVFEVVDRVPKIDPYSNRGLVPNKINGHLQFQNVTFSYPARPSIQVLKNFSLNIEPGQTIALVGTSGGGKSTVVSLLLRLYDIASGEITLDGIPIKDLNLNWWRSQIGVVSQEPVLFGTTIADNIRYGRQDIDQNDIEMAAVMANAHNFIESLPEGYNTLVGDRGAKLSGGQKQRIAIARALVRDPKILLLDEATSALDAYGEAIVQEALERAMLGRTTLVIAHRLSTVKKADVIHAIANGAIVESGTHKELIDKKGIYFGLVLAQANEREDNGFTSGEDFIEYNDGSIYTTEYKEKQSSFSIRDVATVLEPEIKIEDKKVDENIASSFRIKKLIHLTLPEWRWNLLSFGAAICVGCTVPIFAYLYGEIFVTFTLGKDDLQRMSLFWSLMFVALGIYGGASIAIQCYGVVVASEMLIMRVRLLAFSNILRQSISWFDLETNSCGKIITRLARDAPNIKGAAGFRGAQTINSIVTLLAALGMAFYYGWKLAFLLLAAVPLISAGAYQQMKMLRRHQQRDGKYMDDAGRVASECMQNVRTVQSLGNELMFVQLYMKYLELPLKEAKKQAYAYALVFSLSQVVVYLMYAGAFRFGAYLIEIGDMTATDVFKVFFALAFCAAAVGTASAYSQDYSKAKFAAAQLFQLIDEKSDIDVVSCIGVKPVIRGKITFKNVYFHYPSRTDVEVLHNLNFSVEPGKTLALVGASGCGKSTVVSLLERFYDPSQGRVWVDDIDIKAMNIRHLRSHIGVVTQEPVLFDCSIRDNIAYGVEGAEDYNPRVLFHNIMSAAKLANIHDFVISLPQGYDTLVGDKGSQLSGGQKQRIAIARALIRNPKILLLDEATSALDVESEKVVQEALDKAREGRTCIIIAHRLSTIENADWIAVMHHGEVVEQGTHTTLKLKRGRYYKLIKKQQL